MKQLAQPAAPRAGQEQEDEETADGEPEAIEEEEEAGPAVGAAQAEGLQLVEQALGEKEEVLKKVQEEHSRIQERMLALMKEQYHKKIQAAEEQILATQQEQARGGGKNPHLSRKLAELEKHVKELRLKEKEGAQL